MKKNIINYKNPIHLIAVGFGSGLFPKMPGTTGSLAAMLLFPLLQQLSLPTFWAFLIVASILGIWICDITSKDTGVADNPCIVWDEFCGLWLCLGLVNYLSYYNTITLILGFVFFRLFDICKPWPISFFDKKITGGLGIMLDDILAALFATFFTIITVEIYNKF